jgi:hypothetical protein
MSLFSEPIIYTDLESIILLYKNGDLPEDQLAFPYQLSPEKVAWAHRDEIKRLSALVEAYPSSNQQKGKK